LLRTISLVSFAMGAILVSDLQRIDPAWTALQQQIDQACG
jgi:hypothetical protein